MIIIKTDVLPTTNIQEDAIYAVTQSVSHDQSYLAYYMFVKGKWEQVDTTPSDSLLQQQRPQLLYEDWLFQMQTAELTNSITHQGR